MKKITEQELKLIEEILKQYNESINKPTELYVNKQDFNSDCMFEQYMKNADPLKTHILNLCCPCKKCSVWC